MKILIVDDSETNLKLLRAQLEGEGHEALEARDGVEALEVLEQHPASAVISDILMPRMDGYRLCHEIRKDQRFRNLPLIFYTSTYTSQDDEKLAYQLGVDKFLTKPLPVNILLDALQEAIGKKGPHDRKVKSQPNELRVLREYSEVLVRKLEHKNEQLQQMNRELERRVVERTQALEAANRELEAFVYSVSHDLRAPLRHIDGFTHVLLEECAERLDTKGKEYIGFVQGAARRMNELIGDLLRLSRVTRAEMHHERIDLSGLAREVMDELQRNQPERRVELGVTEGLAAEGDKQLMRVMLENLLGNAWKFTQKRPGARIEFGMVRQEGRNVYFVRDNSAGFDMTYVEKLFAPFQRLHTVEDFPGTGIGLATVQRIVHRHSGRIWAKGEVGKGATFYFTI